MVDGYNLAFLRRIKMVKFANIPCLLFTFKIWFVKIKPALNLVYL